MSDASADKGRCIIFARNSLLKRRYPVVSRHKTSEEAPALWISKVESIAFVVLGKQMCGVIFVRWPKTYCDMAVMTSYHPTSVVQSNWGVVGILALSRGQELLPSGVLMLTSL
jgi:hypothetical protein